MEQPANRTTESPSYEDDILRWRASRLARLAGPDGWLTVVGLAWLEEGDNSVGTAPECQVRLPRGPGQIGTITVQKGTVTGAFQGGSGVTHDGEPATTLELRDDAQDEPTTLNLGSVAFYVIRRAGRLAVRIKDADSPARRSFASIESYPIDRRWRFEARFEPYDPPGAVGVPTVLGIDETYVVPGALAFEHEGETHRIEAFLEEGETDLFLVFGDVTNGSETYGGGRYLYTRPPGKDGMVVVDFNKAYNPPCVFTPFATCALPLPQNRLPIRIEAGEKLYGGASLPPVIPRG